MKYPIKITKIMEGHVEIEAESEKEALQIANELYNTWGAELTNMEDCQALKFEIDRHPQVNNALNPATTQRGRKK